MKTLFTIGHSTQSIEEFINLLIQFRIEAVADVRSGPYSKRFPWFNKNDLSRSLKAVGIKYVFVGEELGARRDEPCCYIGSRADYDLISKCDSFKKGIERVKSGVQKMRVSLMCSEHDPIDCHRTILVARHAQKFCTVKHIHKSAKIETHEDLEKRLVRMMGLGDDDMFLSDEERLANAYKRRGEQINFDKRNYI